MTADERRALVLVVEDEPPIADVLRLYLDRAGFDVAAAGVGPAAQVGPLTPRMPAPAPLEPPQLGQGRRSAARGLVELHTYKLAETVPERAEFSRCMVRIVNFDQAQASPDLIWGVHGTTSQRAAQEYARSDAQFRRLQTFRLEISYRVPKLTEVAPLV